MVVFRSKIELPSFRVACSPGDRLRSLIWALPPPAARIGDLMFGHRQSPSVSQAYRRSLDFCPERAVLRSHLHAKLRKIEHSMQSHCRGQGFDSPQLHQPNDFRVGQVFCSPKAATRAIAESAPSIRFVQPLDRSATSTVQCDSKMLSRRLHIDGNSARRGAGTRCVGEEVFGLAPRSLPPHSLSAHR